DLRPGRGDLRAGVGLVDVRRLEELDAEVAGRARYGRRGELLPAAGFAVGARDDELRPVVGGGEAHQHLRRERRRAQEDGSHVVYATPAACSASRSARIAALRCSRLVRSRMSTTARWSISCWITRA